MSTLSFFDSILRQGIGPFFIRSNNPALYPAILIALAFALVITLRIVFVDIRRHRSSRSRNAATLRSELLWDAVILLSQWALIWVIWEAFAIPYDTLPFWRVPAPDAMLGPVGLHGLYYFLAVLLHILVSLFALQALGGIWLPELLPSAFGSDRISALAGVVFSGAAIYGWEAMRWPATFTIPSEIFLIFSFSVMLARIVAPGEPSSDAMARMQYIIVALLDLLGVAAIWQFHHIGLPSDIAGLITRTANPALYPYALATLGISLIAALVNGALTPLEPIRRQNAMQSTMGGVLIVWVSQLVLLWAAWWAITTPITRLPLVSLNTLFALGPLPLAPILAAVAIIAHGTVFALGISNMISIWVSSLLRLPTTGQIGGLFSAFMYSLATYILYQLGWPSWVTAILELVVLSVILTNIDEWLGTLLNWLGASTPDAYRRLTRLKSALRSVVTFVGVGFIALTHATSIYLLDFLVLFFTLTLLDRVVKEFLSTVNLRKSGEDVGLLSPRRWYLTTLIVIVIALAGAAGAFHALSPENAPAYSLWLEVGAAAVAYMLFVPLITFASDSAAKHEDPMRAQTERLERVLLAVQAVGVVADAQPRARTINLPGGLNNFTLPGIPIASPGLGAMSPSGASTGSADKHSLAEEFAKDIRSGLQLPIGPLFFCLALVYHYLTSYLHLTTLLSTSFVPLVFGLIALAASLLQVINRPEMDAPRYVALLLVFIVILISGVTMLFSLAHVPTELDPQLLTNSHLLATLSNESFLSVSLYSLVRELLILLTIGQLFYLFRLIETSLSVAPHASAHTANADENANDFVAHGEWLAQRGEDESACEQFRAALTITDTSAPVIRRAGLGLQRRGKYAEALNAYERAIDLARDEAIYWNDKGVALAALDRLPEALNAYDQATKLEPRYALAWDNKGDALLRNGAFTQALAAYQKAVEFATSNKNTKDIYLNDTCFALLMLRNYGDALDAADRALRIDNKWALAWRNKADALLNLPNRSGDALKATERTLSLQPHSIRGWALYGRALATVGRLDEARNAFERALTFDAEAMDSWGSHGDALIGLGRHDEALKAFDRAIRLDPKDPDNWRSKAIALRALGRAREALEAERQEQLLVGGNAVAP